MAALPPGLDKRTKIKIASFRSTNLDKKQFGTHWSMLHIIALFSIPPSIEPGGCNAKAVGRLGGTARARHSARAVRDLWIGVSMPVEARKVALDNVDAFKADKRVPVVVRDRHQRRRRR